MRPGFSQWGLRSRAVCLAIMALTVAGCAEERSLDDLMHFVETTHRDTAPKVEPLPEHERTWTDTMVDFLATP